MQNMLMIELERYAKINKNFFNNIVLDMDLVIVYDDEKVVVLKDNYNVLSNKSEQERFELVKQWGVA